MIPELPDTYVDHLVAPDGIGDVAEPNAAGEVGSMVGGLGVRITLSYDATQENGAVISELRGRAFGSPAPLAALSWLTAAVEGSSWDEACGHTGSSVLDALCEGNGHVLPDAVERGAEFAVHALRRALGIALHGFPADCTGEGILVCRCLGVGDRRIREAIRSGARDPEAIGDATKACTGCRSCRPDLLALIDEETRPAPPLPDDELHPAARIALARAGPALRALGMPLLDAQVDGDTVWIRLGEPSPGGTISPIGAVAITRHILRETVYADIHVEQMG